MSNEGSVDGLDATIANDEEDEDEDADAFVGKKEAPLEHESMRRILHRMLVVCLHDLAVPYLWMLLRVEGGRYVWRVRDMCG